MNEVYSVSSLPADMGVTYWENLDGLIFSGDEMTLGGIGLADGADVFVWNGKEVRQQENKSYSTNPENLSFNLQKDFWSF